MEQHPCAFSGLFSRLRNFGKTTETTLKETNELFTADLRDPAYAAGYLNIALEEDGVEGFLYALQKVARVHGMSQVAEKSDLPRESLYRPLSEKGNPVIIGIVVQFITERNP